MLRGGGDVRVLVRRGEGDHRRGGDDDGRRLARNLGEGRERDVSVLEKRDGGVVVRDEIDTLGERDGGGGREHLLERQRRLARRLSQRRGRVQSQRARRGRDHLQIRVDRGEAANAGVGAEASPGVRGAQKRAARGELERRHPRVHAYRAARFGRDRRVLVARREVVELRAAVDDGENHPIVFGGFDDVALRLHEESPRGVVADDARHGSNLGDALDGEGVGKFETLLEDRRAASREREAATERGEADELTQERRSVAVERRVVAQALGRVEDGNGGATRDEVGDEGRRTGGRARQSLTHRGGDFHLIGARQARVESAALGDELLDGGHLDGVVNGDRFLGQERLQRARVRAHVPGLELESARHGRERLQIPEKGVVARVELGDDGSVAETRGGVHLRRHEATRGERRGVGQVFLVRVHADLARHRRHRHLAKAQLTKIRRIGRRHEGDHADVARRARHASIGVLNGVADQVHPGRGGVQVRRVANNRVRKVAVLGVARGCAGIDPDGSDEHFVALGRGTAAEESDGRARVGHWGGRGRWRRRRG